MNPSRFDWALSFFRRSGSCKRISDEWGFIDKTGKIVIPPKFFNANDDWGFSEGLLEVYVNGKLGFINKTDDMVIQPQFDWGARFSDGLALVADYTAQAWLY